MLRIAIVEDEPAIARNLQFSLSQIDPGALVMIAIHSVAKAIDWFAANENNYDLVFMDIQLSDGLSFEIFEHAKINTPIIFITAYDEYALQAFKTNGIDYILKPFENEQLSHALIKFRQLSKFGDSNSKLAQLREVTGQLKTGYAKFKQSFLLQFRDKLIPVATKDIAWFVTVNEVSYAILLDKKKFSIECTLEQLLQQLDPHDFFRANRQFIVQRKAIKEVSFYFNGRLLIHTEPATEENMLISKARVPEFKAWMNR